MALNASDTWSSASPSGLTGSRSSSFSPVIRDAVPITSSSRSVVPCVSRRPSAHAISRPIGSANASAIAPCSAISDGGSSSTPAASQTSPFSVIQMTRLWTMP